MAPSASISLIYPHRRFGTLPLNGRTRPFFPGGTSGKAMVSLIDGRWGTRYTGWVCFEGRYIAGLAKWMEDHAIPVGAYITLDRGNRPGEVIVDFRTRRAKREWARIATPDLQHLRVNFELNKIQVTCEYDEQLIVAENDPAGLDAFRKEIDLRQIALYDIVEQVTPELIKLNPQGTVHAKTVYSAVNMMRRTPPGVVFNALIANRKFRDVAGGYFALA
jgi:hypothetical protein